MSDDDILPIYHTALALALLGPPVTPPFLTYFHPKTIRTQLKQLPPFSLSTLLYTPTIWIHPESTIARGTFEPYCEARGSFWRKHLIHFFCRSSCTPIPPTYIGTRCTSRILNPQPRQCPSRLHRQQREGRDSPLSSPSSTSTMRAVPKLRRGSAFLKAVIQPPSMTGACCRSWP